MALFTIGYPAAPLPLLGEVDAQRFVPLLVRDTEREGRIDLCAKNLRFRNHELGTSKCRDSELQFVESRWTRILTLCTTGRSAYWSQSSLLQGSSRINLRPLYWKNRWTISIMIFPVTGIYFAWGKSAACARIFQTWTGHRSRRWLQITVPRMQECQLWRSVKNCQSCEPFLTSANTDEVESSPQAEPRILPSPVLMSGVFLGIHNLHFFPPGMPPQSRPDLAKSKHMFEMWNKCNDSIEKLHDHLSRISGLILTASLMMSAARAWSKCDSTSERRKENWSKWNWKSRFRRMLEPL